MVHLRDSNSYHQIFDHIFLHLNKHLKDSCSLLNKFIQNSDSSIKLSCILEFLLIHTNRLGGSMDIEVTEETVMAFRLPDTSLLDIMLTE